MISKNSSEVVAHQSLEHEIWDTIRKTRSYTDIVDLANLWLPELWGKLREYNLHHHTPRLHDQCPNIKLVQNIRPRAGGIYYPYDHRLGPLIKIANPLIMSGYSTPLYISLRDTVLHEVQHAIDDSYHVWSYTHSHWFDRRLQKLMNIFPVESI